MSKDISIMLGDEFDSFVQSQIDSGRYGSVSDVICAGLRLLEEQNLKLNQLRGELAKGEEGDAGAINRHQKID